MRSDSILLVEDEDAIRAFAARALTRLGYEVESAASAEEAEDLFARIGDRVGLLFTDIRLPGESGLALVAKLRAGRPDLPVLLASGYMDEGQTLAQVGDNRVRFMTKPYSLSQLRASVKALLGADDLSLARA